MKPVILPELVVLDIDGTLVDTNYHHALAWYRAFRRYGLTLLVWKLHRHMGMGGDHLISEVAGEQVEVELGDKIREAEKELYSELIDEVQPIEGGRDLLLELRNMRRTVILASSGKSHEVDHYLDILEARDIVDGWTTSADVQNTKPDPDLVLAALHKGGSTDALMVGDSPFDCMASKKAGIQTVAVLTGGFSPEELSEAGAIEVFESLPELTSRLRQR